MILDRVTDIIYREPPESPKKSINMMLTFLAGWFSSVNTTILFCQIWQEFYIIFHFSLADIPQNAKQDIYYNSHN